MAKKEDREDFWLKLTRKPRTDYNGISYGEVVQYIQRKNGRVSFMGKDQTPLGFGYIADDAAGIAYICDVAKDGADAAKSIRPLVYKHMDLVIEVLPL